MTGAIRLEQHPDQNHEHQGSPPAPDIGVRTVKVADVPERAVQAYAKHRERLAELLTPEALARFDEAERRADEQLFGIRPGDGSDG